MGWTLTTLVFPPSPFPFDRLGASARSAADEDMASPHFRRTTFPVQSLRNLGRRSRRRLLPHSRLATTTTTTKITIIFKLGRRTFHESILNPICRGIEQY